MMKHKEIIIIFLLILILIGLIVAYIIKNSDDFVAENYETIQSDSNTNYSNNKEQKNEKKTTLKQNGNT